MPHEDYLMICPYFHKTLGNTLFCTAVPAANKENCAAYYKQCFTSRVDRNRWLQQYCGAFNYCDCRYAVLNKYLLEKRILPYLP